MKKQITFLSLEPVPEKVAPEDKQADEVENRSLSTNSSYCSSPTNHHHHHRAGQELCYVCMQRGMRNIPVSFSEERRRKELEQDALLQQYQQMKDQEAILMDKVIFFVLKCDCISELRSFIYRKSIKFYSKFLQLFVLFSKKCRLCAPAVFL